MTVGLVGLQRIFKVINPYLRILIVDDQPLQRLCIEKIFNASGYYRVAPVESLEEFLILIEQAIDQFDLVVINSAIKGCAQVGLESVFHTSSSVRNVLMYDGRPAEIDSVDDVGGAIVMKLSGFPEGRSIQGLMRMIDQDAVGRRQKMAGCTRWR